MINSCYTTFSVRCITKYFHVSAVKHEQEKCCHCFGRLAVALFQNDRICVCGAKHSYFLGGYNCTQRSTKYDKTTEP